MSFAIDTTISEDVRRCYVIDSLGSKSIGFVREFILCIDTDALNTLDLASYQPILISLRGADYSIKNSIFYCIKAGIPCEVQYSVDQSMLIGSTEFSQHLETMSQHLESTSSSIVSVTPQPHRIEHFIENIKGVDGFYLKYDYIVFIRRYMIDSYIFVSSTHRDAEEHYIVRSEIDRDFARFVSMNASLLISVVEKLTPLLKSYSDIALLIKFPSLIYFDEYRSFLSKSLSSRMVIGLFINWREFMSILESIKENPKIKNDQRATRAIDAVVARLREIQQDASSVLNIDIGSREEDSENAQQKSRIKAL